MLRNIPRGGCNPPRPEVQQWLTSEAIAGQPSLCYRAGDTFLGTVGSPMRTTVNKRSGREEYHAIGGSLTGISDDRPVFVSGPTRSGKGRSHQTPVLATHRGSACVVDTKGDLATLTAAYRAEVFQQRSYVFDPLGIADPSVEPYRTGVAFNPLCGIDASDEDAVVGAALRIAEALVVVDSQGDSHWDWTALDLIAGVIAHTITWPLHTKRRHLGAVAWLLTHKAVSDDADNPSELEAEMRSNPAAGGYVQAAAASFFDKADRERSSTLSTARKHLSWLNFPALRRMVEGHTADLSRLPGEAMTAYIVLPLGLQKTCRGWTRLMLSSVFAAFERHEDRRGHQFQSAGGSQVLIMIDELPSLGHFSEIEVASATISGLGAKLYLAAQDLNQMKAVYPKSWESFLANSGVSVFLAPQDTTTLGWLEKRLGQTSVIQSSSGEGSLKSIVGEGTSGRSQTLISHPLLSSAEIARVFNRDDPLARQLVISASHGPLITQRVAYDQHPAFAELANWKDR